MSISSSTCSSSKIRVRFSIGSPQAYDIDMDTMHYIQHVSRVLLPISTMRVVHDMRTSVLSPLPPSLLHDICYDTALTQVESPVITWVQVLGSYL